MVHLLGSMDVLIKGHDNFEILLGSQIVPDGGARVKGHEIARLERAHVLGSMNVLQIEWTDMQTDILNTTILNISLGKNVTVSWLPGLKVDKIQLSESHSKVIPLTLFHSVLIVPFLHFNVISTLLQHTSLHLPRSVLNFSRSCLPSCDSSLKPLWFLAALIQMTSDWASDLSL